MKYTLALISQIALHLNGTHEYFRPQATGLGRYYYEVKISMEEKEGKY